MSKKAKKLVLNNGREFAGWGFGADTEAAGEMLFNTSSVGYGQAISDSANLGALVVMTYPVIGSYGISEEDMESRQNTPSAAGLIVGQYNDSPSNFRYTKTLAEAMEESNIPGIEGVDTRAVLLALRQGGATKGMILDAETPAEKSLEMLAGWQPPQDAVQRVTAKKRWYARTQSPRFQVAVLDCGVKLSTIKALNALGCNVTVFPANTPAAEIAALCPDGLVVAGGPGDPKNATAVIETIRALLGQTPLLALGLGHCLTALAAGADTAPLSPLGHHGANHPVKDLRTGAVDTAAQNHRYAVVKETLAPAGLSLTHENMLDGTAEGFANEEKKLLAVQFDPPATTPKGGPSVWQQFADLMKAQQEGGETAHA